MVAGRKIIVQILGDAKSFTKATKDASASAGKFSNILRGVGQGMGIGIANMAGEAASAVVDFAKDSIKAASNLRESMALTEQVFEDNSAAIKTWADNSKDAFSTSEALNFAS
jgi:hypothetical protein